MSHKKCKRLFVLELVVFLWLVSSCQKSSEGPAILWERTYGGNNGDGGNSIQQTSNGGYVIAGYTFSYGSGSSDAYLIKIDVSGNVEWEKTYGGDTADGAVEVKQTSDGGYIVVGYTSSFGAGERDIYLIRTDALGDTVWTKTLGTTGHEVGQSVDCTSDGGYIVVGWTGSSIYLAKVDANGTEVWTKTYWISGSTWAHSVHETFDGGYILGGEVYPSGETTSDIYLIKTDAIGNIIWEKSYGGTEREWCYAVQQTSDNGYIITGTTRSFGEGNDDVYVVKTDENGDTVWTQTAGGSSNDHGTAVRQTADGGYVIAGFVSLSSGFHNFYLVRVAENGDILWEENYGGFYDEKANDVLQAEDGSFILVGWQIPDTDENRDIYLIKTEPESP